MAKIKATDISLVMKLQGDLHNVAYVSLQEVLPAITNYNIKTNNNSIIRGKWHKKKR